MRAVIFLGPSCPDLALDDPRITLRPPAAAGDIYRAARQGFALIGLIDGRFEDRQTVQHKEILYALSRGVHVWGGASMGALRAVECGPYGMRGFGDIFTLYRDGVIDGDHEVAVSYGPADLGYPALSEPMVNVRATVASAVASGCIDVGDGEAILSTAGGVHYKDLTWDVLAARLSSRGTGNKLMAYLPHGRIDLKARDARLVVEKVQQAVAETMDPFLADFELQPTHHWRAFVKRYARTEDRLSPDDALVLDEVRLDPVRYRELILRAFARRALGDGAIDDAAQTDRRVDLFRGDLGLTTAQYFDDWLAGNRTDSSSLSAFLARDERLDEALHESADTLTQDVLDELRAEDDYGPLLERAQAKSSAVAGRDPTAMPPQFADFDLRDLIAWFCRSRRIAADFDDLDDAARSLGLSDRRALHVLLRREFEYARLTQDGGPRAGAE